MSENNKHLLDTTPIQASTPKSPPRKFKGAVATLAVLGLLIGGSFAIQRLAASQRDSPETVYITAPISRGSLNATVTATGKLKAVVQVKVGSQLSGQIVQLHVDFNDRVKIGQPIAQLDARSYRAKVREAAAAVRLAEAKVALKQAAIAEAEANLKRAQALLEVVRERVAGFQARKAEAQRVVQRSERLRQSPAFSQATFEKALTEMQAMRATWRAEQNQLSFESAGISASEALLLSARAELDDAMASVELRQARLSQAEIELSRTTIVSPIDGHVIGRNVDTGQTVATNLEAPTLFEIAHDLSHMEVHLRVDEADIGQVGLGQRVSFTVDAYSGRPFEGVVKQLRKAPEVVEHVVTYTVVVSASNLDYRLLPGMTANAQIFTMERHDVIRVPDAALRFRPHGETSISSAQADKKTGTGLVQSREGARDAKVWIVGRSGDLTAVSVQVGTSDKRARELVSGPLKPGDRVIVGMVPNSKRRTMFGLRFGF